MSNASSTNLQHIECPFCDFWAGWARNQGRSGNEAASLLAYQYQAERSERDATATERDEVGAADLRLQCCFPSLCRCSVN